MMYVKVIWTPWFMTRPIQHWFLCIERDIQGLPVLLEGRGGPPVSCLIPRVRGKPLLPQSSPSSRLTGFSGHPERAVDGAGWQGHQVNPAPNNTRTPPGGPGRSLQPAAGSPHCLINALSLWKPAYGQLPAGDWPSNGRCLQNRPPSLVEGIFHVKDPQAEALVISKTHSPLQENRNSLFMTDRNPPRHQREQNKDIFITNANPSEHKRAVASNPPLCTTYTSSRNTQHSL